MQPTPAGWPRLSTAVYYDDAARAIDWLCQAFDFDLRLKVEGDTGAIVHSELTYGEAVIMVAQSGPKPKLPKMPPGASPRALPGGGNTQNVMLYVDDVDAHYARALAAGAAIIDPPNVHDYGEEYWADKSYGCLDPEGHMWWITQRLRSAASQK